MVSFVSFARGVSTALPLRIANPLTRTTINSLPGLKISKLAARTFSNKKSLENIVLFSLKIRDNLDKGTRYAESGNFTDAHRYFRKAQNLNEIYLVVESEAKLKIESLVDALKSKEVLTREELKILTKYYEPLTLFNDPKNPNHLVNLSKCYHYGIGGFYLDRKSDNKIVQLLQSHSINSVFEITVFLAKEAVTQGGEGPNELYYLARLYETSDRKESIRLYKKAADLGSACAKNSLAYFYWYGIDVKQDLKKAVELYTESAKLGDARAKNNLAYCYEKGIGVDKDLEKEVELYKEAADLGDADAKNNLGYCYERGIVVERDLEKAVELYKEAADSGSVSAKKALKSLRNLRLEGFLEAPSYPGYS